MTEDTGWICKNCGNFNVRTDKCPKCGNPKVNSQAKIMTSQEQSSPLGCPKCHRIDNISKVSVIVQSGTHQISGQIPVSHTYQDSDGWHERTSYESYNATQQTALARKLMPPEKPQKGQSGWVGLIFLAGWIVVIMGMMSVVGFQDGIQRSNVLAILGGIALCPTSLGAMYGLWRFYRYTDKPHREKLAKDLAIWEASMRKWQELYYCFRDDCIFFSGESRAYNLNEKNQAINWLIVAPQDPITKFLSNFTNNRQ